MNKKALIVIASIIIAGILVAAYIFVIGPLEANTGGPEMNLKKDSTDIASGDTVDLGAVTRGFTCDFTFTIENTGTGPLNLSNTPTHVTISGAGYSLKDDTSIFIIPTSGSTTFNISFSMFISGWYQGSITIENNDSDENPYTFTVIIRAGYSHTIVIDGTNDFYANETFSTTTAGYTSYITWDDTNLYVGMNGTDIGSGSEKWILIYVGGSGGTTTGMTYNTQQPSLPFSALYQVRARTDSSNSGRLGWTGVSWTNYGILPSCYLANHYVEMVIPIDDIGNPTTSLQIHISIIDYGVGTEWTYAGVPNTSFSDNYDPNYYHYYDFNLNGTIAPANYTPI